MSNCFENIIGIKGQCGALSEPTSGLYLNDLPFIDLKVADAVLTDEDSGVQFLTDKINYAVNAMQAELNTLLQPYYKRNSVLEENLLGQYIENMTALPSEAVYKGIQVKIEQFQYLEFRVSRIALYSSNTTGNVTIKVFDLITGAELDSFPVAVVAGEVSYVEVNKNYFTDKQKLNLFFAYDASTVDSFETNLFRGRECSSCGTNSGFGTRHAFFNSASIGLVASKIQSNLDYTNNSAGLSIMYSISCSNKAWMCSMKDQLAYGVLHKAGVEILKEVVHGSRRVNSVTTIDKDSAAALMQDFEMIYKEAVQNVLHNVRFPNDICFRCDQRIRVVSRIP